MNNNYVESLSNIFLKEYIRKSQNDEFYNIKKSSPKENQKTIAIVINFAEYSEAKKKFIEEQNKFKNNNVIIYGLKYYEVIKITDYFFFSNDIQIDYLFYDTHCYYSVLSKEEIITKINEKYEKYDDIIFYF
jgi:hypothetical protein